MKKLLILVFFCYFGTLNAQCFHNFLFSQCDQECKAECIKCYRLTTHFKNTLPYLLYMNSKEHEIRVRSNEMIIYNTQSNKQNTYQIRHIIYSDTVYIETNIGLAWYYESEFYFNGKFYK